MKRMTESYNVVNLTIKDAFYYSDFFEHVILLKPIPNTIYLIDTTGIGDNDRYTLVYANSMTDLTPRFLYEPNAPAGLEFTMDKPCYSVVYKDTPPDTYVAVASHCSYAIVFYPTDNQ